MLCVSPPKKKEKEEISNALQVFFLHLSGAILINNFIFSQFLGCCPFLGCSSKVDTAVGMGLAVTFVMGLASAICWVVDEYVLMPLGLAFLQTLTFILVIAALVQFVEMFLEEVHSLPVLGTGHLPAPYHHQLRSSRCCSSERSE